MLFKNHLLMLLFNCALYVFFVGMSATILQYTEFETDVAFLKYKQALVHYPWWRAVFYTHVFTCFVCLMAGFTQFSNFFQSNFNRLHRIIGKVYVFNVLFINFPTALVLAITAHGGLVSQIAFVILDVLWAFYTWKAFQSIKQKDIIKHQQFIIRSFALTLTAVTFRLISMGFPYIVDWPYTTIYRFDSWATLIINSAIAEGVIWIKFRNSF